VTLFPVDTLADLHIAYADISAVHRRKNQPLYRGSFDRVCEDKITSPFALSSATREGPGVKLRYECLVGIQEILRQTAKHLSERESPDIEWRFEHQWAERIYRSSVLRPDAQAPDEAPSFVKILADIAVIGLHVDLELSNDSVFLTLTAPATRDKLLEVLSSTIHSLSEYRVDTLPSTTGGTKTAIGAIDDKRELTSTRLTIATLHDLEETCKSRVRGKINVVSYRSLLYVSGRENNDTYNSVKDFKLRHGKQEFPAGTREVKLRMCFFTSQEQADQYPDALPVTLHGALVILTFTRTDAVLQVTGNLPNATDFVKTILDEINKELSSSNNNHHFAHNALVLISCSVLSLASSVVVAISFKENLGVIFTMLSLMLASILVLGVLPRLYPYVVFDNAESERRRKTQVQISKAVVFTILLPIIVELFKKKYG
jgi:hypothetical protein